MTTQAYNAALDALDNLNDRELALLHQQVSNRMQNKGVEDVEGSWTGVTEAIGELFAETDPSEDSPAYRYLKQFILDSPAGQDPEEGHVWISELNNMLEELTELKEAERRSQSESFDSYVHKELKTLKSEMIDFFSEFDRM